VLLYVFMFIGESACTDLLDRVEVKNKTKHSFPVFIVDILFLFGM
jgi:hypothetical protein